MHRFVRQALYRFRTATQIRSLTSSSGSHMDREKELFIVRKDLAGHYGAGRYSEALKCAQRIEADTKDIYGEKTSIFASSLNNTALMLKTMGENKAAIEKYIKALHVYEDVLGQRHLYCAAVLSNLGSLYRVMAQEEEKPAMKTELLELAERATVESYALRVELSGEDSKEVMESQLLYSSILRDQGNILKAESQLVATMEKCKSKLKGPDSLLTATILNNLGFLRKGLGRFEDAERDYNEALKMRAAFLQKNHPDVIIVKHNLAELYMAMQLPDLAAKIQEEILEASGENEDGEGEEGFEEGREKVEENDINSKRH